MKTIYADRKNWLAFSTNIRTCSSFTYIHTYIRTYIHTYSTYSTYIRTCTSYKKSFVFVWCPCVAINVSVQHNGGFFTRDYTVDPMLLPSGNPFKCHEEVLYLQLTIPPKRFDILPLTGGCSEGLDAVTTSGHPYPSSILVGTKSAFTAVT